MGRQAVLMPDSMNSPLTHPPYPLLSSGADSSQPVWRAVNLPFWAPISNPTPVEGRQRLGQLTDTRQSECQVHFTGPLGLQMLSLRSLGCPLPTPPAAEDAAWGGST